MPFKSEAQRQRAQRLVKEGTLSQEKYDEWESGTPKDIPDRVQKTQPVTKRPAYYRRPK